MTALNTRINIEQRTSSVDAIGQPVETWELVAAVWANIKRLTGLSSIKSGADISIVQASIRLRYRAGLNAGMRVTQGAETYDIRAVLPDSRKQYIDLVCQQVA